MKTQFDCIVVGGGIVGLTAALALAEKNFIIALVEAAPFIFAYDNSNFDARVSAITRSSENIFKNLNVWEGMVAERISPYTRMRVWEEQGDGNIEFAAEKIAESNLGHIIENRVIQKNLFNKLATHPNVTLFNPCQCVELYHHNDDIALQLDDNQEIRAKLIIGADGANSWIRERAEFDLFKKDYNHHAIVATVTTELPHNKTARQRFLTEGVLALLPLCEPHTHSIVWSTAPKKAEYLMELGDIDFSASLTNAFSSTLGITQVQSKRHSFPLTMRHVKNYAKPRIVLVGDAAHTVHPLAGQGVNLGLLDAASLAAVLQEVKQAGRDFGLLQHLRKYERARKGDNQLMSLAMSGFKNLFGQENSAVVWARTLGLNLTDKAEPVKNLFIKKAMGLIGDLPPLARITP